MSDNITRDDINILVSFLQQDPIPQLTNGPKVREFESKWSEWVGVKYSIMVNSGSSANILTLLCLKELHKNSKKREIIVPPLCWVSDVAAILHAGFIPVFCDINLTNLSYDINKLKNVITENTLGIISVSILGLNCYTDEFLKLVTDNELVLIGDHCESYGATYNGKKLGSLPEEFVSNYSFFFAHLASTIEGGMISTNDHSLYQLLRANRSHGMAREMTDNVLKQSIINNNPQLNKDFIFISPSYNFRSTELNAVIGLNQLKRIDSNVTLRSDNYKLFLEHIDSNKYITDLNIEGHANYAFMVILKEKDIVKRDFIEKTLLENGIEFRRGLSGGGSQLQQPYLIGKEYISNGEFPNMEHIHTYSWYIGNYPDLEKEKILQFVNILNKC
jgi:CDP-6-deoxy-D-xylo-4-hexulose-3-dehydrase